MTLKVMLAKKYTDETDPSGWHMSEKFDGVRTVWDGSKFTSRNGKTFQAPDWFKKHLPDNVILDGELWEDRGKFQTTVGKVRAHKGDWSQMKFMIFDIISKDDFETRQETLKSLDLPSHCKIVEHILCEDEQHLNEFESSILALNGEGVMLRKAKSLYAHKRSYDLLKVKRFQTDEAKIIGFTEGYGKYADCVGAFICEYMGKVFNLGSGLKDAQREYPPEIGSHVTFSFFEKTNGGIPRFPSFVAVRNYE